MFEYKWDRLTLAEIRDVLSASPQEDLWESLQGLQLDRRKNVRAFCQHLIKKCEKERLEKERMVRMWSRELELVQKGCKYIAGIDEAGRGPLAGPVVAAAVILPQGCDLPFLNDSKKLQPAVREELAVLIREKSVAWAVGVADHGEIDKINILQATKKAMTKAVARLSPVPDYLLLDALNLEVPIPQEGIIQGDAQCACIAAASIIAKTYRDSLMDMADLLYPQYGFKEHKGYGTSRHFKALKEYGACPVHRKSFLQRLSYG